MAFEKYLKILEEEKLKLESDLAKIARKNPDDPSDWQVKAPQMDPMVSDQSELADMFEEMENQAGLEFQLERRLKSVVDSLERIRNGQYGTCIVCSNPIEERRLEANPMAKACIKHAKYPPFQ